MKKITNPSQLSDEYVAACELYLLTQAYVEQVKADLTPIFQSVIDKHAFQVEERFRFGMEHVTSYTQTYLMSDEDFRIYLAEVIPQVAALGYKVSQDLEEYSCPYSAAQSLLFEVRKHMLNLCVAELKMLTPDELSWAVDKWGKIADLMVKLAGPRIRTGGEIVASMFPESAQPYYELCSRLH